MKTKRWLVLMGCLIERERLTGETLIAYATGPGKTAADGGGALSPYTTALVAELAVPGKSLWEVFGAVTARVQRATDAKQQPWKNDTLVRAHVLVPPASGAAVPEAPPPMAVAAAVGHLQVNVDAPGTRVWVDGREVGSAGPGTPLNLSNLALGTVRVEASAPGRTRVERSVALQAGAWVQLALNLPAAGPTAGDTRTEPRTGAEVALTFSGSSWISVRDSAGASILNGQMHNGDTRVLSGNPPYSLIIGNPGAIQVTVGGRPTNLGTHVPGNAKRFKFDPSNPE